MILARSAAAALIACAALAAGPAYAEHTLLMHVVSPKGAPSKTPTSDLLRAADVALKERTNLELRSLEQFGLTADELAGCPNETRLACWTGAVSAGAEVPAFLLVLAVHPDSSGADALYAILLDLADAAPRVAAAREPRAAGPHAANPSAADPRALEDELYPAATEAKSTRVDTANEAARLDYFRVLFDHQLRPILERRNFWGKRRAPPAVADTGLHGAQPARDGLDAKTATLITSAAIGAAGAALSIHGLLNLENGDYLCITRNGENPACPSGQEPPATLYTGLALFTAAGVTALATWLFGQDDEIPWLPIAAGAIAGGLVFGTGAFLDAR